MEKLNLNAKRPSILEKAIENSNSQVILKRLSILKESLSTNILEALICGVYTDVTIDIEKFISTRLEKRDAEINNKTTVSYKFNIDSQTVTFYYLKMRYFEDENDKYGTSYPSKNKTYYKSEPTETYDSYDIVCIYDLVIKGTLL